MEGTAAGNKENRLQAKRARRSFSLNAGQKTFSDISVKNDILDSSDEQRNLRTSKKRKKEEKEQKIVKFHV